MLATLRDFCGSWGVMSNIVPKHSSRIDQPFQEAGLIRRIYLFCTERDRTSFWGINSTCIKYVVWNFRTLSDISSSTRFALSRFVTLPRLPARPSALFKSCWRGFGKAEGRFLNACWWLLSLILDVHTLLHCWWANAWALSASCAFPLQLHALSCYRFSEIYLILDPKHTRD